MWYWDDYTGIFIPMSRPKVSREATTWAHSLGTHVRRRRDSLGLSREALAQASGISAEAIRKLETGRSATPEFFTVVRIAGPLELSLDELVAACMAGSQEVDTA